jgi:hypothetical protein
VGIVLLSARRHLARDKRLATVVWALVILLPAGQAMRRSRATYPFVRWGMYASTSPPQMYQEYLIRDDGDSVYHYPFGHIAFSSPRAFMIRLEQLVQACSCAGGDQLVDDVIEAFASIHRDRTGRTVTQFEVYDVPVTPGPEQPGARTLRYTWRPRALGS